MRRAPEGSALWTPAGASAPGPGMLSHPCFACGRDGGQGACISVYTVMTGPPERLRAGRFPAVKEKRLLIIYEFACI